MKKRKALRFKMPVPTLRTVFLDTDGTRLHRLSEAQKRMPACMYGDKEKRILYVQLLTPGQAVAVKQTFEERQAAH